MLDDSLTAGHLEPTNAAEPTSVTAGETEDNATRGGERGEDRTLEVGERFAGFLVRGVLGRGAMGVVYEAWDPTLERRVALKLLRSPSKRAAERLLREARALARLDHPGVVRIWAADVHRGAIYIAMELIEGQNLREWLQSERSWGEILPVLIGAGRGLAAAHAAGVIHRDFKPENVLVGWDGQARVLDFGIARISTQHPEHLSSTIDGSLAGAEHDDEPLSGSFAALPTDGDETEAPEEASPLGDLGDLTEAGVLIGTLLYMAPEQHGRERADERSDQFAFCTTLFEAIYGAHPFPARSRSELALLVAEGNVQFPEGSRGRVPRWLERVILRGLSPAREDRYATMEDLIDALERHPRRRRRRNRVLAVAAVASAAIGLGLMVPRAEPVDPCVDVASELDGALGADQRERIAARFASLDVAWAAELGERVDAELEDWAGRWVEARTETCELRHGHREATVIDARREACLATQLDEVDALGSVLSKAQKRSLANAERALTALPEPARCLGDEPPVGRSVDAGDEPLLDELLELEWLARTGGDSRTVQRAATLVEKIRALPRSDANDSLLADALVTLAEAKLLEGEHGEAEALLREAARTAERVRADGIRAHAIVDLGWTLATTPGRSEEAVRVLEDAAALLERVGNPPYELDRQRQALGEALLASGEPARAREVFEAMLADAGSDSLDRLTTLHGLSRVAIVEQDPGEALDHAQAALELVESRGRSPLLASPLTNVGLALTELGRYDEAREALERSLELRRAQLAGETGAGPGNHRRLAEGLINLAILESKAGRPEVAADAYREALSLIPEDDHASRSLVLFNLGVDHQIAGRSTQALANYQEALRLAERVLPLDSPQVVGARLGVGSMLVTLGRPAEARGPLERCLADWPESMNDSLDEAELRFALARTLLSLEGWSTRTETQAGESAGLYRRLDDVASAERVEAWLAANDGPNKLTSR